MAFDMWGDVKPRPSRRGLRRSAVSRRRNCLSGKQATLANMSSWAFSTSRSRAAYAQIRCILPIAAVGPTMQRVSSSRSITTIVLANSHRPRQLIRPSLDA